jgi:hypothetical protein
MSFGPKDVSLKDVWDRNRALAEKVQQENGRLRQQAAERRRSEDAQVRERRHSLRQHHHQVMHDNRGREAAVGTILYDGFYADLSPETGRSPSPTPSELSHGSRRGRAQRHYLADEDPDPDHLNEVPIASPRPLRSATTRPQGVKSLTFAQASRSCPPTGGDPQTAALTFRSMESADSYAGGGVYDW